LKELLPDRGGDDEAFRETIAIRSSAARASFETVLERIEDGTLMPPDASL
jgi:hypothetical protein